MPYIPKSQREKVESGLYVDAGSLNYAFTQMIDDYITQHELNYQTCNDIVGAMECCKMELYRRLVAGYEDKKILLNGDVKPYEK
jgi:hypothetical protein